MSCPQGRYDEGGSKAKTFRRSRAIRHLRTPNHKLLPLTSPWVEAETKARKVRDVLPACEGAELIPAYRGTRAVAPEELSKDEAPCRS